MPRPKTLETRHPYRGRVVHVAVERIELPNGQVTELEIIRHPGAAAVVPLLPGGEVVLVHQYRYATSDWLLEVPAGKLDSGEAPEVCARREVEEETGYRVGKIASLGWIWTTPGFTDEKIWLFLATDLSTAKQRLEPDEVLSVRPMSFSEAVEMARAGQINDSKSVCALLRAAHYLGT